MIEREKALLPITQPIIERIHKIRNLNITNYDLNHSILVKRYEERETLFRLRNNRTGLIAEGMRMKQVDLSMSETLTDSDQSDDERQEIRKLHAKLPQILQEDLRAWSAVRRELRVLQEKKRANDTILARLYQKNQRRREMIQQYYDTGVMNTDYVTESETEDIEDNRHTRRRRVFVRKCPQEDCKGFLNQQWVCGLCQSRVCSKCHETKVEGEGEHTCNPESIATAEMLAKDTKSCPQCGVQIHKIDGCNMMFCTQCHTAFCWRTGEIIKNERVHNPHYYEWLRQNSRDGTIPREQGDNPCDAQGHITMRTLRTKLQGCNLLSYDLEDLLWNIHRIHVHIELVEIPRLANVFTNNTDLRVRYMLNEYTETMWKHEMYKRKKRAEKSTAIRQVYEMIHTVIIEEFRKILESDPLLFPHILEAITTFENLRIYANAQFLEISKLYQCKTPLIQESTWNISSQRADTRVRRRQFHTTSVADT